MDSKALAKSKRAHSLHHSKKQFHSGQKAKVKAPTGGATDAASGNKAVGKQTREKARQSGLPSNCDRYEEEFDSGSGDPLGDSINNASDIILPKSKGADYRHLIAEAQSQCQSGSYLDMFPSLEDILPDFKLGVGPMLSVRGEGILSWTGDDNFVVEDESAVSPEAHFLSLNLSALAEQLLKVDISERLFMEADILPPELSGHGAKATSSLESEQKQTSEMKVNSTVSEELILKDLSEKNEFAKQSSEVMSSESILTGQSDPISLNQEFDMINKTEGDFSASRHSSSCENRAMESPAEISGSSIADPKKKPYMFEATAAEAELDMLLDSFNETKFLDSSGFTSAAFPLSKKEAPRALPQLIRNTPSSSKTSISATLDDALDDLLEQTSNLSNQNNSYQSVKVTATSNEMQSSSSSRSVTKSKVLDDFDSWLDTL
ncbi:protein ECERIFERUM 16 isoform X2 [Ricinus communis]|uniref:protein ECERIFERUM 16 isoform X2 n=1 Tax=Ricinus communis TaxID=3988 RepID=UPI000772C25E|nr:protein ECERIFERUM 16 isoform X2 [Ricinus communis]|eukprot:XP_015574021.1 uncharacterized protein LOC8269113 isoform X2 [Ricinus communis]